MFRYITCQCNCYIETTPAMEERKKSGRERRGMRLKKEQREEKEMDGVTFNLFEKGKE